MKKKKKKKKKKAKKNKKRNKSDIEKLMGTTIMLMSMTMMPEMQF